MIPLLLRFLETLLYKRNITHLNHELMIYHLSWFQSYCFLHCLYSEVDLIRKRLSFYVRADGHIRMTNPCSKSFIIQLSCELRSLCSRSIIFESVKFFCSFGCCIHEDNWVISFVSNIRPSPAWLIKKCLELFFCHVGCAVDSASVTEDKSGFFGHISQFGNVVLEVDLVFDQV